MYVINVDDVWNFILAINSQARTLTHFVRAQDCVAGRVLLLLVYY